jgi:hypothetical protein
LHVEIVAAQIPEKRLAKIKVDADFTAPCNPSILYPNDGGNMHCFTAVTACAVLDVLGPPYSDPDGRHCAYYRSFPFSNFPGKYIASFNEWIRFYLSLDKNVKTMHVGCTSQNSTPYTQCYIVHIYAKNVGIFRS